MKYELNDISKNYKYNDENDFISSMLSCTESMNNMKKAAERISENGTVKLKTGHCSHCDSAILYDGTVYCEDCYQKLISDNAKLYSENKKNISKDSIEFFMGNLRLILIKKETVQYNTKDKINDIFELYLRHIVKLGGIKYESND